MGHITAAAVTEQIARFAVETDLSKADDATLHLATRAFVDTIGVAIAGTADASIPILTDVLNLDAGPPGHSTLLGSGETVSAQHAALLNAFAGHALDLDDHLSDVMGHPSVVLVPTLMAMGEDLDRSGREVLEAYIVGHQVMCAIAAALPVRPHWREGWHATSTVGILAATAAACRLSGLTVDQARHALGIAASLASGSRQNSGYAMKPLNVGMAASNAVLAASLAGRGLDADPCQLEGRIGYFHVFGTEPDLTEVRGVLDEGWTLNTRGLNVKTIPACYAVHHVARAAMRMATDDIAPENIRSISVTVQPGGMEGPIHHLPQTGAQAKFSIEFAVVAALLDGSLTTRSFSDTSVVRPEVQRLLPLTSVREANRPHVGPPTYERSFSIIHVVTQSGAEFTERADTPRGHASDPLTDQELEDKFSQCTSEAGTWSPPSLVRRLWSLATAKQVRGILRP